MSNETLYDLPSSYHLALCLCDLLHFWYYPLFLELHWPLIVLGYPGMHSLTAFALADPSVWKHFMQIYISFSFPLSRFLIFLSPSASSFYSSITFLVKTFLAIWCNKVVYLLHVLLSLTYSIFLLNTYHYWNTTYFIYLAYYLLPPLEYKLHEGILFSFVFTPVTKILADTGAL